MEHSAPLVIDASWRNVLPLCPACDEMILGFDLPVVPQLGPGPAKLQLRLGRGSLRWLAASIQGYLKEGPRPDGRLCPVCRTQSAGSAGKPAMEQLKAWLERTGTRQSVLVERLRISPGHMSALLSGQRKPSRDLSFRIEDATEGAVSARVWSGLPPAQPQPPTEDAA